MEEKFNNPLEAVDYYLKKRDIIDNFLKIIYTIEPIFKEINMLFEWKENEYNFKKQEVDNELSLLNFLMKEELLTGKEGLFDILGDSLKI